MAKGTILLKKLKGWSSEKISVHELNSLGIYKKDIKWLISNGRLKKQGQNMYMIVEVIDPVKKAYYDSLKLAVEGNYDDAQKCFRECCSKNIRYVDDIFKLILDYINERRYYLVFDFLKLILGLDDNRYSKYVSDAKFYLYLLGFIVELPPELELVVKDLKYEDIKLNDGDDRYYNIAGNNRSRKCALNVSFEFFGFKHSNKSNYELIFQRLILRIQTKKRGSLRKILNAVLRGEFDAILSELESERKRKHLGRLELIAESLVRKISGVKRGTLKLELSNVAVSSLEEAVEKNNLQLALSIIKKFKKTGDFDDSKDNIIYLIQYLWRLINEPLFYNIVECLVDSSKRNIDEAKELIREYLESVGYQKYFPLVVDLFEICRMDEYRDCTVILSFLGKIKEGNFELDVDLFVDYLEDALAYGREDVAKKYFGIILMLVELGVVISKNTLENIRNIIEFIGCNGINVEDIEGPKIDGDEKLKFENDDYYYGIENIEKIRTDIEKKGLSIEKACAELGITEEIMNLIRLIYAKDYYSLGFKSDGDSLVLAVSKFSKRSQRINIALSEIRGNRALYCNQPRISSIKITKIMKA